MMPANVKLSKKELSLVCDEHFILTKNNIIDKVYNLFGLLSNNFTDHLSTNTGLLSPEILSTSPKIYKGEQYLGLPYVMLDHPRRFYREDAFAIRCFFWWGNFFSITLHLGGHYAQLYKTSVVNLIKNNESNTWFYCVNENQWQHNFDEANYIPLNKIFHQSTDELFADRTFFKISKKIPLQQWDDVYEFYNKNFLEILSLLKQ